LFKRPILEKAGKLNFEMTYSIFNHQPGNNFGAVFGSPAKSVLKNED
jgi:hypothetical protein